MPLFSKTRALEADIDKFYSLLQENGLHFNGGIKEYVRGEMESFLKRIEEVTRVEKRADELRRDIEYNLYTYMLIPESRGDVLGLLETTDNVINQIKKVLNNFSVERPIIPQDLRRDFVIIGDYTSSIVGELVGASNCFFRNYGTITEHVNKVYYYEGEIDKVENRLKRRIFQEVEGLEMAEKIHLRYFTEKAAVVSDLCQEVCERLIIYAIKRTI